MRYNDQSVLIFACPSSIVAFAYNKPTSFIETNIRTVFIYFFFKDQAAVTDKDLVYLNDSLITKNELKEKISLMHKKDPDLKVIVFSDRLARFKDIVTVLDILNGEGIRNLNIAARIREP